MKFCLSLLVPAALAIAGCADNSEDSGAGTTDGATGGDTDEPAPTAVALEEFFDQAEAAYCAWAVACRAYGAENRCRKVLHFEDRMSLSWLTGGSGSPAMSTAYVAEAVEVGRILYDGEKAAVCLASVRQRSCDLPWLDQPSPEALAGKQACAEIFTGRMGKNGPCMVALECAEQAICGFDPTCADMCCVGACRVLAQPLAVGEPCGQNPNQSCEAGSYCAFDPNTFNPTVCTSLPGLGQPCGTSGQCDSGSTCDYDLPQPTCAALAALGERCYGAYDCAQPALCHYDYNINFEYGVCILPADEGEPCDPAAAEYACRRVDNECNAASKTCGPLPAAFEPCPNWRCRGDLYCTQSQVCSPLADDGERCGYINNQFLPCSGDHICDYELDNGTCRAPNGESLCPVPEDSGA